MNATATANDNLGYQVSSHGAGRFSVQCLDGDRRIDEPLIRDTNGWRRRGGEIQYGSIEELAADIFAEFAGLPSGRAEWHEIEKQFRSRV